MPPPPISRSSLSSLTRCSSLQSTSLTATRAFSTTQSSRKIGPENPKFIEIPHVPQQSARSKRDIKGTLPAPRNLFPRRAGDKTSFEYLFATTPEPRISHDSAHAADEYIAWKRRLAAQRRNSLRESLVELHDRKIRTDRRVAYRSQKKREDRDARVNAPPREDERLTSPTVMAANKVLQRGAIPDPNREARLQASIANVKAKMEMSAQHRIQTLHQLYMHARNFITTEAELQEAIEKTFTATPFKHIPGKEHVQNIWNAEGMPPTVQDMLSQVNNTQKSAMLYHEPPAVITGKRLTKIAEELTGGKMDH